MIKQNKTHGRKMMGGPAPPMTKPSERRSQQEPTTRPSSTLQDQLAEDNNGRSASEQVQASMSNTDRRQMQMESISVSEPSDLNLSQAIKNRRSGKRSNKK